MSTPQQVSDETQTLPSMGWDDFVQLMEARGFIADTPMIGNSSVRFDPPNPKDPSVTFHKPHPETFIHPIKLNELNKTLRNMYGFTTDEPIQAGHETRYLTSMRWEDFVQLLEARGFTTEPLTQGYRVRFDPPNGRDPSVIFHKPHPEPYIHHLKLHEYNQTLRSIYGFTINNSE